jgi:hypothetical protein
MKILSFTILAVLCVGFALAEKPKAQKAGKDTAPASREDRESISGRRVFRDPETGLLRPAQPSELRQLTPPQARAAERAVVIKLPGGGVALRPSFSEMDFTVVRRNADGSVSTSCVQGLESAERAMKRPERRAEVEGER